MKSREVYRERPGAGGLVALRGNGEFASSVSTPLVALSENPET